MFFRCNMVKMLEEYPQLKISIVPIVELLVEIGSFEKKKLKTCKHNLMMETSWVPYSTISLLNIWQNFYRHTPACTTQISPIKNKSSNFCNQWGNDYRWRDPLWLVSIIREFLTALCPPNLPTDNPFALHGLPDQKPLFKLLPIFKQASNYLDDQKPSYFRFNYCG